MGKPRSDSVLKSAALRSEEFGEKLWEWCNAEKTETCVGGLRYAKEQLAADGIVLGGGWLRQLSEFYSWWEINRETTASDSFATDMVELLRTKFPDMKPQQISELQHLFFTMKASNARNSEEWREMEYLKLARETAATKGRQKEEELALKKNREARESCTLFLRWYSDLKTREIADSNLSNADKIAALRAKYFADVDALERSGEVDIPE